MAADWLILVSAFVTIALATSLLAAGPIYADAVTVSALQRTLEDAQVSESNVTVNVNVFPERFDTADEVARSTLAQTFSLIGADIHGHIEAEAFQIGAQNEEAETIELASFQSFEDIEDKATVIEGRWATTTSSPYETTVLDAAATALNLSVGDTIEVVNRRDENMSLTVEIVGLYQPNEPSDAYWFGDELALTGLELSTSFTTYGPFVISGETMTEHFTRARVDADWITLPHFENLGVNQVDQLRANVGSLETTLEESFFDATSGEIESSSPFRATTSLDTLLNEVDRSLTVTRASVLALLIQLAILAGYALVLMAGLVADIRRVETTLLRSRGASPSQIVWMTLLEALALVGPAFLIGPYVATGLLRILNVVGPIADIGLAIDPMTSPEAFWLSAVAGALALIALAAPAYRSAKEFKDTRKRRRQQSRTPGQRFGIDVALLAVAFVVFWQLDSIGAQITARVGGQFGVDPLLVVAPALGLLAGAVLALRIVPLMARGAEWLATSRKSTVAALASWQVARRPLRYARSSLLLMMAIGIGFFAAAYGATWATSQRDQAAFELGADVVVIPNRSGAALTDIHLPNAYDAVDGVGSAMPVESRLGSVSRSGDLGNFMIIDSSLASETVLIRPDLSANFDELMVQVEAGRPTMGGYDLGEHPTRLGLTFDAIEELPEQPFPPGCEATEEREAICVEPVPLFEGRLRVVVQDANDRLHRLDLGWIPVNEGPVRMTADLVTTGSDGVNIEPAYPLRLINIEIRNHLPTEPRTVELIFGGISVFEEGWSNIDAGREWGEWLLSTSSVIGASIRSSIAANGMTPDGQLVMNVETGSGFFVAPAYFSMRVSGPGLPPTFPVVVTDSFLTKNSVAIGDQIRFPALDLINDTGVIIGSIEAFPTVDPDVADAIIVDRPTIQMLSYEPRRQIRRAEAYWISTDRGDDDVVVALAGPPIQSFKIDSVLEDAATRGSDPVALGTIGALTVGFVAAAVFASVGFAVSATVSARERLVEFALVRALGLSPRQLGGWLFLEQGALVFTSLGLGTLIGIVLTATILPLISLTQDGSAAFPQVIVEYPWPTIVTLEAAVIVVLGLIVTLMTFALRRVGLGGLLRIGED